MDSSAIQIGSSVCAENFKNTNLNDDLQSLNIDPICNLDSYVSVAVIDCIIAGLFVLIHSAWGLTSDLYKDKVNKKGHSKPLLST